MGTEVIRRTWSAGDWRESLSELASAQARFLVFHQDDYEPGTPPVSDTELVLEYDPRVVIRSAAIRDLLGPSLNLVARCPDCDAALWIPKPLWERHSAFAQNAESLVELVVHLADAVPLTFVPTGASSSVPHGLPELAIPRRTPPAWLEERIAGWERRCSSRAKAAAVVAGLYLLNDCFEESHSASQSQEGIGDHTADYWHAILHRREPDYGNARYWFHHVGRHPVLTRLGRELPAQLGDRKPPARASSVLSGESWDPIAFVNACAAAESDRGLQSWCRQVQYLEMQFLLEHALRQSGL